MLIVIVCTLSSSSSLRLGTKLRCRQSHDNQTKTRVPQSQDSNHTTIKRRRGYANHTTAITRESNDDEGTSISRQQSHNNQMTRRVHQIHDNQTTTRVHQGTAIGRVRGRGNANCNVPRERVQQRPRNNLCNQQPMQQQPVQRQPMQQQPSNSNHQMTRGWLVSRRQLFGGNTTIK